LLCIFSIPAACLGMIKTPSGLTTVRFFIGILGGTFVVCQYWCSRMFAKQVVGTAQGLTAGWGTLGTRRMAVEASSASTISLESTFPTRRRHDEPCAWEYPHAHFHCDVQR
jgi:nitrate/nitrite transporter NarK